VRLTRACECKLFVAKTCRIVKAERGKLLVRARAVTAVWTKEIYIGRRFTRAELSVTLAVLNVLGAHLHFVVRAGGMCIARMERFFQNGIHLLSGM
jgi:hypothetical protein